jgi:phage-related holin
MESFKEWIIKFGFVALAALAPIHAMIISIFVVVLVDFITGIMAAYKLGEKITSAGFRRTVSKLAIYQLALISGYLIEVHLMYDVFPIVKIIGGVVGLVELTSILENCNIVYGGNLFRALLQRVGSVNDVITKSRKGKKNAK